MCSVRHIMSCTPRCPYTSGTKHSISYCHHTSQPSLPLSLPPSLTPSHITHTPFCLTPCPPSLTPCPSLPPSPVLGEDKQLFRVVELLQHVGEELAPPALAATQLHQQQAGVEADLGCAADTQVLEELLARLVVEGALQHRRHRVAWVWGGVWERGGRR